jgi:outer membrane protein assembly factor BamA
VLPILGCRRDKREVMIRERFFLGGTSSLRGFAYKGAGPRAQRRSAPTKGSATDSLGGDLFATVRAAVRSILQSLLHTESQAQ